MDDEILKRIWKGRVYLNECRSFLDFELIEMVNESLEASRIDPQKSVTKWKECHDELGNFNPTERQKKRKIRDLLGAITNLIETIEDPESIPDTREQQLANDIYALRDRTSRHYLSWLLTSVRFS